MSVIDLFSGEQDVWDYEKLFDKYTRAFKAAGSERLDGALAR